MQKTRYVSLFWAVLAAGIPLVLNAVWDRETEIRSMSRGLETLQVRVEKVEDRVQACLIEGKIEAERRRLLEQYLRQLKDP